MDGTHHADTGIPGGGAMATLLEFESLDSTHAYARKHLNDLGDRSVVLAKTQTRGKGRKNRAWVSDAGGLYFTLVLRPPFNPHLHTLTQLLCLAVCRAVEELGLTASIKWPNDVLINGKKLAGILSEAVFEGTAFRALLLGAGVNVAQRAIPLEGREAASLLAEGRAVPPADVLAGVLRFFFARYDHVLERGFAAIRGDYLARFHGEGTRVTVETENGPMHGIVKTVSKDGKLVLLSTGNVIHEVLTGEIV